MRIGIDLGGTKTEGVVIDSSGAVQAQARRATPSAQGYAAVVENIIALIDVLEQRVGKRCRIGIGTPGSCSRRDGTLKNSNTLCLNGKPLQQDLEQRLGRALRIENDANCFALSEARDGAAADAEVVFGVILGTGVGGGIVFRGQLHVGVQHLAGEWGHNVLEPDGPKCYCGKSGCVETLISGPGLARDWRQQAHDRAITPQEIVIRARQGDALSQRVLERYIDRFGRALALVVNILDPDIIVLGGGLSNMDCLYTAGRAALSQHVFNDELATRLVRNRHGDSSGVRGAARLWPAED